LSIVGIGAGRRRPARGSLVLLVASLCISFAAGCGSDDEPEQTRKSDKPAKTVPEDGPPGEPADAATARSVRSTVGRFIDRRHDGRRVCGLLSSRVLENETGEQGAEAEAACRRDPAPPAADESYPAAADADIRAITSEGGRARAIVAGSGVPRRRILLERESGEWKIVGSTQVTGGGRG
jgi:hypothetical protein